MARDAYVLCSPVQHMVVLQRYLAYLVQLYGSKVRLLRFVTSWGKW
eukprot:COSAG03_NODE_21582_length_302_cov_1.019704_1_plen_45_part_10